ncbi:MAG: hypothetical protein ABIQ06_09785 [Caldimonas sp.]
MKSACEAALAELARGRVPPLHCLELLNVLDDAGALNSGHATPWRCQLTDDGGD